MDACASLLRCYDTMPPFSHSLTLSMDITGNAATEFSRSQKQLHQQRHNSEATSASDRPAFEPDGGGVVNVVGVAGGLHTQRK